MSGLELLGAGAGLIGTGLSAGSTLMGANASASASDASRYSDLLTGVYRKQSLDWAADEAQATGQRQAEQITQQKNLLQSKAQAVAAGSGAGADDTTVQNLEGGIESQGEYQKLMSMYQGNERASGLRDEGNNALIGAINKSNADDYSARMTRANAPLTAVGTLLSGASTLAGRFSNNRTIPNFG